MASTECNSCGCCCHPVSLPYTQREYAQLLPGTIDEEDRQFVLSELRQLKKREGLALAPWLRGHMLADKHGQPVDVVFYECKHFDVETRRCTNYENRPGMCRDFPWYDGVPRRQAALAPYCSFNADVGRPVEPVPVEWSQTRQGPQSED